MRLPSVPLLGAVIALVTLAACNQRVYSPPSQTFAVTPIHVLAPGQKAVDAEVSAHSEIFGPSINAFDARYRTGVGANTEVTVEGAAHVIDDQGPSMADRSFYSGRVGARTNPGKSGVTFFAGGGGGFANAGGEFVSVDSGMALGFENCYVVPVFQVSGFVSQPLHPRPIDVSDDTDMPREYDTPSTTVGGTMRGGLRVSLSPARCHQGEQVPWITLGLGFTSMSDGDSHDVMTGAGVGVELPL
jgi:hypothetical protein